MFQMQFFFKFLIHHYRDIGIFALFNRRNAEIKQCKFFCVKILMIKFNDVVYPIYIRTRVARHQLDNTFIPDKTVHVAVLENNPNKYS